MELSIYTGNFGSGKTEISLNHAFREARQGKKVTLIDLDIVKPYFRSRETRKALEREGIKLVMPQEGLADADIPVVTPLIAGVLTSGEGVCIIDVGGDSLGATALGRFKPHLEKQAGYLQLVVNPYRPYTKNLSGVKRMIESIEGASRLKVNYLISNPNLGTETTPEEIISGHNQVLAISEQLRIPIKFLAVFRPCLNQVREAFSDIELFPVDNYMIPPWELEEGNVHSIDPHLRLRRDE